MSYYILYNTDIVYCMLYKKRNFSQITMSSKNRLYKNRIIYLKSVRFSDTV